MRTVLKKLRGDKMPIPPHLGRKAIAITWAGSFIAIALLTLATDFWQATLLMAPFGASCLLVFGYPEGIFSQPRNVVGGYVLSSIIGLLCLSVFGLAWWSLAFAVATAIALTMWLGIPHPPSGATPIVIFLSHSGWSFVLFPSLAGAVLIVLIALVYNNLMRKYRYPKYW